jgi:general secretion pathway protein K
MTLPDAPRGHARIAAERGAAVVLAMLLAALAATIAATLFADQQRWTRTVLQRRDQVQAQALVMAGVQWARQILYGDGREKRIDHLGEPWAAALPPIPLENGEIRGAITDATARLNVNALDGSGAGGDAQRQSLERLFAQHGGPVGAIDAIADWIDADGVARPNGAEDAFYAGQRVPGLAANGPAIRVAELAAVRGVPLPALAAVAPFITALPAATPVNVNTAPPEVLAAILRDARGDAVAALAASRAQRPFSDIADFRGRLPQGATVAGESLLAVRSDYFYVSVEARQGTTIARARALLHRGGPGKALPAVVWQVVE